MVTLINHKLSITWACRVAIFDNFVFEFELMKLKFFCNWVDCSSGFWSHISK